MSTTETLAGMHLTGRRVVGYGTDLAELESEDGSLYTAIVLDEKFRTMTNAAGRSLHGYSMGGFGALKLAFKHPELVRSVVAYGATLSVATEFYKHLGRV